MPTKSNVSKTRRLNILFLPAWYPTQQNPIAGVFIREHARAAALYHNVVVLFYEGQGPTIRRWYQIVSDQVECGIRTIRLRHRRLLPPKTSYAIYLWSIFSAFRAILKQGFRPDVIHAHVYSAALPAVILGRLYGIPVAVSEHWTGFVQRRLTLTQVLSARFALNAAEVILPVSQDLGRALKSYGIRTRLVVVPSSVDTKLFYPAAGNSNNGIKRVLFVGIVTPQKGLPYLLQALAKLKCKRQDFQLDIVGEVDEQAEYDRLTDRLRLDGSVKFHGRQPEVASFMRNCDFLVLPSLWENLPSVVVEAMACGRPVVCSKVGGIPEVVNESNGLLVPPADVKALAAAIDWMLDNHQKYRPKLVAAYAQERFSHEAVGQKLDEVYRGLVCGSTGDAKPAFV
jgi:glycosyltransferase involved in cell wall biosynthesis